jgi:hypothetical protein
MDPRTSKDGVENILISTGTQTPTPRSSSPHLVGIPTELSRLQSCKVTTQNFTFKKNNGGFLQPNKLGHHTVFRNVFFFIRSR